MAKVILATLRSYTELARDLVLVRGENLDIPKYKVEHLEDDPRFKIVYSASDFDPANQKQPTAAAPVIDLTKETSTPNEADAVDENGVPRDKQKRLGLIAGAMLMLNLDNEEHYTKSGKPDARALTQILGWQVTAVDRDTVLDLNSKGKLEPIEPTPITPEPANEQPQGEHNDGTGETPDPTKDAAPAPLKGKLVIGTKKPATEAEADEGHEV